MISPHTFILASAGSGKTFCLTNAYLKLLAGGADPATILATTFTRKAAGEIVDRLLQRLAKGAVDPEELETLCEHVDPTLTAEKCAALLKVLVSGMHRMSVLTLDAFLLRVASTVAMEMGENPSWTLANEHEETVLREDAVASVLDEIDTTSLYSVMYALYEGGSQRLHQQLCELVRNGYTTWLRAGMQREPWEVIQGDEPLESQVVAEHEREIGRWLSMDPPPWGQHKTWKKTVATLYGAIAVGDWRGFLGNTLVAKALEGAPYCKRKLPPEVSATLLSLHAHAIAYEFARLADRNRAFFALAVAYHKALRAQKRHTGLMSFDDLPGMILSSSMADQLENLYYRLDARCQHILLDEFQDTSLEQYGVLKPMLDEIRSQQTDRTVFCVGDVKQSLYMWRNAEPALLQTIPGEFGVEPEPLSKSWRSAPAIMDAVNIVFGRDLSAEDALEGRPLAPFHAPIDHHETARTELRGMVRVRTVSSEFKHKERLRACMRLAADRAKEISASCPQASIGILFRRGKPLHEQLEYLRRLDVPAAQEGGTILTDSQGVAAALSLLQLADHPNDTAAAFHVASTPVGDVVGLHRYDDSGERTRVASFIRHRLLADGYLRVLMDVYTGTRSVMAKRCRGRFAQLLDLAAQYDQGATARPTEFVRFVKRTPVDEPGHERVRVMTIHGSKGLEFDVVILPELHVGIGLRMSEFLSRKDRFDQPAVVASSFIKKDLASHNDAAHELVESVKQRRTTEELCSLYVAMTRARHLLECIVPPKPDRKSMAALVLSTLAPDLAGDDLFEMGEPGFEDQVTEREKEAASEESERGPDRALSLSPSSRAVGRRMARVSPSGLAQAKRVRGSTAFDWSVDEGRVRGLILHKWFEAIEWIDDGARTAGQLSTLASEFTADGALIGRFSREFAALLESDAIRESLGRERYSTWRNADLSLTLHREWPFLLEQEVNGVPRVLQGTFDRVVLGVGADGRIARAEIIDFKTDTATTRKDAEQIAAKYQGQMVAYQQALAELTGLAAEQVTVSLLLTSMGAMVQVLPTISVHSEAPH